MVTAKDFIMTPEFLVGFGLGLGISFLFVLVLRSRVKKMNVYYEKAIKMYQVKIKDIKKKLDESSKETFRERNLCKTAQKLPERPERDPSWKIDIPPCVLN